MTIIQNQTVQTYPDVYAYNIIYDQDPDILNQGSLDHIKKYFDKKQAEAKANAKNNYETKYIIIPKNNEYSINNVSFDIKIILLIIFVMIALDFLKTN